MAYFNTLFFEDYWNIGISEGDISQFVENKSPDIYWYPKPKKEQFLADPFLVRDPHDASTLHIFCEIFSFKSDRGKIGHLTFNTDKKVFSEVKSVLEEPYHLAYPFLIKKDDEFFMIPETSENSQVSLYKAIDFPSKWEKIHVLIDDYQGVDNSILLHDNRWWLFSTDMEKGQHSWLNIFYSDDLQGEWIPHPDNPVKTGADNHRCAGTPFNYDGKMIRPAMNCVHKYGENIILNQIKTLTKESFEEKRVGKIDPYQNSSFSNKTHTIATIGDYTVVDGCKETFFCLNPHMIPYKIKFLSNRVASRFKR